MITFRTLLVVLLLTATCAAQDRYVSLPEYSSFGTFRNLVNDSGDSEVKIRSQHYLDVTIDHKNSATVHESTYLFEPRTTVTIDGVTLELFVEFKVDEATFPLVPWHRDGRYGPPTKEIIEPSVSASPQSVPVISQTPQVRVFGSYLDSKFDLSLDDLEPDWGPYFWLWADYNEDDILRRLQTRIAFFSQVDFGFGDVRLGVYNGPPGRDFQRVPTLEELETLLPGDADMDGEVTFSDFLVLSDRFGGRGTWGHGDFNQDFDVNFDDFLIQSAHFGQSRNVAAIPEPSAMMLLGIGLLFLKRRRLSQ